MERVETSTKPKPFVFVLMPINDETENVYKFGIKAAAAEIGAYAERVDEQNFSEGILERIFNQINKADVIVADMTGRNPNVFYEVGYAHALGKTVLLLTQNINDIPFDLKHRQHIEYGLSIDALQRALADKLQWAITQSQLRASAVTSVENLSLLVVATPVPPWQPPMEVPRIIGTATNRHTFVNVIIQNQTISNQPVIGKAWLFGPSVATQFPADKAHWTKYPSFGVKGLGLPYGLDRMYAIEGGNITLASTGAVEAFRLAFLIPPPTTKTDDIYMLRIQTNVKPHDFLFRMETTYSAPAQRKNDNANPKPEPKEKSDA